MGSGFFLVDFVYEVELIFVVGFTLKDIALSTEIIRPLLPPNPYLRSLKVDCGKLDDSAIELMLRPTLHDLCLHNCADFSGKLLSGIGGKCKDLRSILHSHLFYPHKTSCML